MTRPLTSSQLALQEAAYNRVIEAFKKKIATGCSLEDAIGEAESVAAANYDSNKLYEKLVDAVKPAAEAAKGRDELNLEKYVELCIGALSSGGHYSLDSSEIGAYRALSKIFRYATEYDTFSIATTTIATVNTDNKPSADELAEDIIRRYEEGTTVDLYNLRHFRSLGYPRSPASITPDVSLGRNDFCIPEFSRATLSVLGDAEIKFSSEEEAKAFERRLLGLRVDDEVNPLGTARVCPFKKGTVSVDNKSVRIADIPTDVPGLEKLLERIRDSDQAREFAKRDVERRLDQTTRSVTFISSAGIIPALQAGVGTLFAGLHRLLHPWCPGSAVVGSIASVACRSAARNFESVGHSLPQKSREAFYRGAKGLNKHCRIC